VAGVTIAVSGYYQAIGNARMAIILTLIRQVVLFLPMLLIMPYFFELDGVWIAIPVTDFAALLVTLALLKRELARLKRTSEPRPEGRIGVSPSSDCVSDAYF
jgi:Na+-driven multidrug efflux pump